MIEQDAAGTLQGRDLDEWQVLQSELEAAERWPDKWSQDECKSLINRRRVAEWRFYENYGLDKKKWYEFHSITGVITEAPIFDVTLEDEG